MWDFIGEILGGLAELARRRGSLRFLVAFVLVTIAIIVWIAVKGL